MLAAVETTLLAIGVLLSGPPFLVGALVLREMREDRHWRAVVLVAVMAAYLACPDIGKFLPKKKKLGWFESLFSTALGQIHTSLYVVSILFSKFLFSFQHGTNAPEQDD